MNRRWFRENFGQLTPSHPIEVGGLRLIAGPMQQEKRVTMPIFKAWKQRLSLEVSVYRIVFIVPMSNFPREKVPQCLHKWLVDVTTVEVTDEAPFSFDNVYLFDDGCPRDMLGPNVWHSDLCMEE